MFGRVYKDICIFLAIQFLLWQSLVETSVRVYSWEDNIMLMRGTRGWNRSTCLFLMVLTMLVPLAGCISMASKRIHLKMGHQTVCLAVCMSFLIDNFIHNTLYDTTSILKTLLNCMTIIMIYVERTKRSEWSTQNTHSGTIHSHYYFLMDKIYSIDDHIRELSSRHHTSLYLLFVASVQFAWMMTLHMFLLKYGINRETARQRHILDAAHISFIMSMASKDTSGVLENKDVFETRVKSMYFGALRTKQELHDKCVNYINNYIINKGKPNEKTL